MMKKVGVLLVFSFLFYSVISFAQSTPIPVPTPLVTDLSEYLPVVDGSDIEYFLASINGLKGLGSLGIGLLIVQGLLLLLRSSFVKLEGKTKLSIASGLSVVVGVLIMRLNGIDMYGALLHGSTLAAINTFVHQVVKQFTEKV
jgi:hypothetical protein